MDNATINIEHYLSNGVAKTLLIPLWCCATPCQANPDASYDRKAIALLEQLEYDFSEIQNSFKEYGQVCCLAREINIDAQVRAFVQQYPNGIIVNLGCGLSTAAYRSDLQNVTWYEIDFPEVIAVRHKLLPPVPGHVLIAQDIFNPIWMDDIATHATNGALFIAAGVFHYQLPHQMQSFLQALSRRFPKGRLFFDAVSTTGMKISNYYIKKSGNNDALMTFAVDKAAHLSTWAKINDYVESVQELPYFQGIDPKPLTFASRINMAIGALLHMLKYINITFKEALGD